MKTLASFALLIASLIVLPMSAMQMDVTPVPFIGINLQFHDMAVRKQTNDLTMIGTHPKINFAAGMHLNDYLSVEAGYNFIYTTNKYYQSHFSVFNGGSSELKLTGPNMDVTFKLPVTENLKLTHGLGLAHLKGSWDITDRQSSVSNISKTRTIPKGSLGFEYRLTDSANVKGAIGVLDTRHFHYTANGYQVTPKMSQYFSLGIDFAL